jgi:hypothetical protein
MPDVAGACHGSCGGFAAAPRGRLRDAEAERPGPPLDANTPYGRVPLGFHARRRAAWPLPHPADDRPQSRLRVLSDFREDGGSSSGGRLRRCRGGRGDSSSSRRKRSWSRMLHRRTRYPAISTNAAVSARSQSPPSGMRWVTRSCRAAQPPPRAGPRLRQGGQARPQPYPDPKQLAGFLRASGMRRCGRSF